MGGVYTVKYCIFEEKKNKSSENYEMIKKSFKGITEVMEEMNERFYKSAEEGRIDKYANSFNNFDSGFEYDVPFGIVDVLQTYITPRDPNEGSIIGDWGLGIGDWAQSPIPNPQSPIPIFLSLRK
jgi:hypothetical protein